MVKKKHMGMWKRSYSIEGNKRRYAANYVYEVGCLKHYKYVDPKTKEKQSICIYIAVFPLGDSRREWFFRVGAVAKNGVYVGTLDTQLLGITFKTAEQAKAMALRSYKKWLLNQPDVIYKK